MSGRLIEKLKFVTSPWIPEKTSGAPLWGASKEKGLLPFQTRFLIAKNFEGKADFPRDYIPGVSKEEIARLNNPAEQNQSYDKVIPGWGHWRYNAYFYPNHLMTEWGNKNRVHFHDFTGKTKLASLNFVPVDIDFDHSKGFGMEEAMFLIDGLPLKPDVIVFTGNGLHIYWSVKGLHIFPPYELRAHSDYQLKIQGITHLENRAKHLLKSITQLVNGDPQASHNIKGLRRIPCTYNYKIYGNETPSPIRGCYINGDIAQAYHNPAYELEELVECYSSEIKKCNTVISLNPPLQYEYKVDKRPPKKLEGIDEALGKLCKKMNINKVNKNFFRFFEMVYGWRHQTRYLEPRDSDCKTAGIPRRDLKKIREYFIINGIIEKLSDHEFNSQNRKSAFYRPTRKFFDLIEEERPINKTRVESISCGTYPPHQANDLMFSDFIKLRNLGISEQEIRKIIEKKIERRPLKRNYFECMERLDRFFK